MSDKVTYATFQIYVTEKLTVEEGKKAPKIIIKPETVNWPKDDVEGLKIEVWRREVMKKYTTQTAILVCQPF